MNPRIAKRFAVGVGIGALIYLGFAIYADFNELQRVLREFPWTWFVPVLALSLVNYFVRFARWQIYLRRSESRLATPVSLRIFFAGLVMSVTPGKFGELLKAYMVKSYDGTPVSRTGPIVIAERVTDLVALCFLICVGAFVYHTGWLAVVISAGVSVALVVGLVSPRVTHWVLHIVERIGFLRPYGERIERAYESMRFLMRPKLFAQATGLAALAWFAECLGFALVARGFGIEITLGFAVFVYAFSTLVGALLLVPGGLGGTEGTMVAMLMGAGASKELAVAATFLTRIATLWFAVLIGALVLLADQRLARESQELG